MQNKLLRGLGVGLTAVSLAFGTAAVTAAPAHAAPTTVVVKLGDRNQSVVILQANLRSLGFLYPQYATGTMNAQTVAGVKLYQTAHKWYANGTVTQTLYNYLTASARAARAAGSNVIAYPGEKNASVKVAQLNLVTLGRLSSSLAGGTMGPFTTAAIKKYQTAKGYAATGKLTAKQYNLLGADARARKAALAAAAKKAAAATPRYIDKRCLTAGKVMCINKTTRKLYYVVNGKVVRTFDARFGAAATPTREGSFTVFQMSKNWTSTLYGSSMPYAMFFSGGEAVHYSYDFAARGYNGHSHGCVNIRDWSGIAWMYSQTHIGSKVVVYH